MSIKKTAETILNYMNEPKGAKIVTNSEFAEALRLSMLYGGCFSYDEAYEWAKNIKGV